MLFLVVTAAGAGAELANLWVDRPVLPNPHIMITTVGAGPQTAIDLPIRQLVETPAPISIPAALTAAILAPAILRSRTARRKALAST